MNNLPPPLQAAKWLKCQMLVSRDEMSSLFNELGDFSIYLVSGITPSGQGELPKSVFLETYGRYIAQLESGTVPTDPLFRTHFSSVFSLVPDALVALPMDENRQIVRVIKPVLQLQWHNIGYSSLEGKFRPMVLGPDSISWGIQFSYPQLYQEPVQKEVEKVTDSIEFPNTPLFHRLQRWMRQATLPTPFIVNGKKINVPMRLGKGCFDWINTHPQLVAKEIQVETPHGSRTSSHRQ